jgi:hypothetical protein
MLKMPISRLATLVIAELSARGISVRDQLIEDGSQLPVLRFAQQIVGDEVERLVILKIWKRRLKTSSSQRDKAFHKEFLVEFLRGRSVRGYFANLDAVFVIRRPHIGTQPLSVFL